MNSVSTLFQSMDELRLYKKSRGIQMPRIKSKISIWLKRSEISYNIVGYTQNKRFVHLYVRYLYLFPLIYHLFHSKNERSRFHYDIPRELFMETKMIYLRNFCSTNSLYTFLTVIVLSHDSIEKMTAGNFFVSSGKIIIIFA